MKQCATCKSFFSKLDFYKDSRAKDGLYSHCKSCHSSKYVRPWQSKNSEHYKLVVSHYSKTHPEQGRAKVHKHYLANKGKVLAYNKAWRKANLGIMNAHHASRRAAKRHAKPFWVNSDELKAVYLRCKEMTKSTGILHHVDHIVPLKNSLVCGLHVPWNLQIIPAILNHQKYNKFQ
jgi:hypothetical protein